MPCSSGVSSLALLESVFSVKSELLLKPSSSTGHLRCSRANSSTHTDPADVVGGTTVLDGPSEEVGGTLVLLVSSSDVVGTGVVVSSGGGQFLQVSMSNRSALSPLPVRGYTLHAFAHMN